MTVEFVYWGSHELLNRLTHPQHVARVRVWFDIHGFDGAWFTARLDEARKTAGPRYTPEVHVDLPIAAELEAFGHTEGFFDHIKAHARDIRKKLQTFEHSISESVEPAWVNLASALSSKVQAVLSDLGAVTVQPIGGLPFQRIADQAVAQTAGCRALVLIDAINEGSGRLIWPSHLAAFLAHLERSPWIGVLLSVRSSDEEIVIPEDVRARAVSVTHHGFAEHEYDAMRTFFVHYNLELPSTPLLAPEFRNPLFLKTLCRGLNVKGERRLPRGFHGITAVFDLYLNAINDRLASALGFNPKGALVRQALEAFAKALVASGECWLTLAKAEEVVNATLPGREFERSLYRGLVVEGVLMEEAIWREDAAREEVVFMAYDRSADHLIAKTLLDAHLDTDTPASAFSDGAPLAFVCDESHYVSPGLLEAMCIQIPERTGQELPLLAPELEARWGIEDAFRQSLVWRAPTAFSQDTREVLNRLVRTRHDLEDTLDVLLTVAMLPEHPLNANFLDQRLRKDRMPERDAWWSTYLHGAWRTHGAVDRLGDWASAVSPTATLDDETVDLCATTLSWMLTTSNRFLRDRATQALVSLLTGRQPCLGSLLARSDFRFDLGRILVIPLSIEDFLVGDSNFFLVLFDVVQSCLNVARGQAKQRCNAITVPPFSCIVKDVVDGDSRPLDLRATATIDDLRTHGEPSCRCYCNYLHACKNL